MSHKMQAEHNDTKTTTKNYVTDAATSDVEKLKNCPKIELRRQGKQHVIA